MTALTDALGHPNIKRIFLAEITAGNEITAWTADTGTTYYSTASYLVTDVKEDGASLTERSTLADCRSNTGSWYYDSSNSRVYVNATAGADPYTKTIQAVYQFYFSNHAVIFNNNYYEPRIKSIPSLSLRIEEKFTGVIQLGGGTITFNNEDAYFDSISSLQWRSGMTTIRMGVDHITAMAYADYETIGTWLNENWSINDGTFTLRLTEYKIRIKNKIPNETYTRTDYPLMREKDIGRALQIAYGAVKDANPVCTDLSTRTFKLANHAIVGIDSIRVKNESSGVWEQKSAASTTLASGTFTMSSADWSDGAEIAVDFRGKATGSIVMDNAADIVKDILQTYVLEPASSIDSTSFTDAHNTLDGGILFNSSNRKTHYPIAVYIDKPIEADKIISTINATVGAYLFADSTGKYYYKVFDPVQGEGLIEFTEADILDISIDISTENVTKASVKYNKRYLQGWSEVKDHENDRYQHIFGYSAANFKEYDAYVSESTYALALAQKIVAYEGPESKSIRISVHSRIAATIQPSDFVRIIYSRLEIDNVFEVLSINHNLSGDKTTLVLGNNHGLDERYGFWMSDSDVLPTRFSNLTGYGSGSLTWNDNWDDEIKTWVRQNVGYWTDANGFASTTDLESNNATGWI